MPKRNRRRSEKSHLRRNSRRKDWPQIPGITQRDMRHMMSAAGRPPPANSPQPSQPPHPPQSSQPPDPPQPPQPPLTIIHTPPQQPVRFSTPPPRFPTVPPLLSPIPTPPFDLCRRMDRILRRTLNPSLDALRTEMEDNTWKDLILATYLRNRKQEEGQRIHEMFTGEEQLVRLADLEAIRISYRLRKGGQLIKWRIR